MRIRYKYYIENVETTKLIAAEATKARLESVDLYTVPSSNVPGFKVQVVINKAQDSAQWLIIDDFSGIIKVSKTVKNLLKAQRDVIKTLKDLGVEVKMDTRRKRL